MDITKDPYSALLIICDELQEWGRNSGERGKKAEIMKLTFCFNYAAETPSIFVTLSYSRNRNVGIINLDDKIKKKERELNRKFQDRIKKLEICVKCEPS